MLLQILFMVIAVFSIESTAFGTECSGEELSKAKQIPKTFGGNAPSLTPPNYKVAYIGGLALGGKRGTEKLLSSLKDAGIDLLVLLGNVNMAGK
jgi:hypothetical protein